MAYNFSFSIEGASEFVKKVKDSKDIFEKNISIGLVKAGHRVVEAAGTKAPYKTGALKGSINVGTPYSTGNNMKVAVGTKLKYARAQEYGTRGMLIHARSKNGKAYSYTGNIKGKRYFETGVNESKGIVREIIDDAVDKAVRELIS